MSQSTKAAGKAAHFNMNPLTAADVWDFVRIIGKIGLKQVMEAVPEDLLKKARFKKPTMLKAGKIVEMPRSKWTDRQVQAETDAEIARDQLSLSVMAAVMDNISVCEDDVNSLLGRSIGKTKDEIIKMPAGDYLELISQFTSRDEFMDFFERALKLAGIHMELPTSSPADTKAQ